MSPLRRSRTAFLPRKRPRQERSRFTVEAILEAAKRWHANDPYAKAGLFARSDIRPWKLTFNPRNLDF